MKNKKRVLLAICFLLSVFMLNTPVVLAAKSTEKKQTAKEQTTKEQTAKEILKKALYYKQKDTDLVTLDFYGDINSYSKEWDNTYDTKIESSHRMQIKSGSYQEHQSVTTVNNGTITDKDQYTQYKADTNTFTSYYRESQDDEYVQTIANTNISTEKMTNYKYLYKYMSNIKFSNKNIKKNGLDAYYITAKFDCAKYMAKTDSEKDFFASVVKSLYNKPVSTKGVYATAKVYVNKKTGQLISLTLDMNQYVKLAGKESFKSHYNYNQNDTLSSNFSIDITSKDSYITILINPKNYDKIDLPKSYVRQVFNDNDELTSRIYFENDKMYFESQYYEKGFIWCHYDEHEVLQYRIETNYSDEFSYVYQYENGKLIDEYKSARIDSVTVSNVKELLDAIPKYNVIYLEEGEYNLSDVKGQVSTWYNDYVYLYETYDGFELLFENVKHLMLIGKENASIVIDPRYSTVLNFVNCEDIKLKNLTVGHTEEKGECTGGVLYFEKTNNVKIENCNLYGCGTVGITTNQVENMNVTDTQIYECTYSIMTLDQTKNATFTNCVFRDNDGYEMINLYQSSGITYNNCKIYNNQRVSEWSEYFITSSGCNKILFKSCEIYDNTNEYKLTDDKQITFTDCKIK